MTISQSTIVDTDGSTNGSTNGRHQWLDQWLYDGRHQWLYDRRHDWKSIYNSRYRPNRLDGQVGIYNSQYTGPGSTNGSTDLNTIQYIDNSINIIYQRQWKNVNKPINWPNLDQIPTKARPFTDQYRAKTKLTLSFSFRLVDKTNRPYSPKTE